MRLHLFLHLYTTFVSRTRRGITVNHLPCGSRHPVHLQQRLQATTAQLRSVRQEPASRARTSPDWPAGTLRSVHEFPWPAAR